MAEPVIGATAVLDPAATPGPGRDRGRHRPLQAAASVGVLGLVAVLALTFTGGSSHHTYAGISDDSTLAGAIGSPALQSQGIPVKIALPHGSVLATVTGPETPGQGLPFQQDFDTTTWSVHLTDATTDVPLALSEFDTLDHGGVVGHPVLVPGTTAPPAVLKAGQSVTFQIRESMVVGEGIMRFAPNGNDIEAKWDFEVEND